MQNEEDCNLISKQRGIQIASALIGLIAIFPLVVYYLFYEGQYQLFGLMAYGMMVLFAMSELGAFVASMAVILYVLSQKHGLSLWQCLVWMVFGIVLVGMFCFTNPLLAFNFAGICSIGVSVVGIFAAEIEIRRQRIASGF